MSADDVWLAGGLLAPQPTRTATKSGVKIRMGSPPERAASRDRDRIPLKIPFFEFDWTSTIPRDAQLGAAHGCARRPPRDADVRAALGSARERHPDRPAQARGSVARNARACHRAPGSPEHDHRRLQGAHGTGPGGGPTGRRNLRFREGAVNLRGAGRDTAGLTGPDLPAPATAPAVAADLPARSTDGADPLPRGARRAAVPDRGARPRVPECSPPPRPEA